MRTTIFRWIYTEPFLPFNQVVRREVRRRKVILSIIGAFFAWGVADLGAAFYRLIRGLL